MEITPRRIIWHHTGDTSIGPQLDKIDRDHKRRGFPKSSMGYYVGYHYLIEHDGKIIQCRKDTEIGAHDKGENLDSIGIGLSGNFSIQLPTEAQERAAAALMAELTEKHKIRITHIEPHRRDDATECPGKRMDDNWIIRIYLKRHKDPIYRAIYYLCRFVDIL